MTPKIFFEHFGNEPADAAKFYELIGRVIVVWGRIEATMDHALLEVMHHKSCVGGRRPISNAFTAKMDCWEEVFRSEPMVADCRENALSLVADARELHEARNRLIHASLNHLQPDGTSLAFKFDHKKGRTFYTRYKMGIIDLQEHLHAAISLSARVGAEATGITLRVLAPNLSDVGRCRVAS